MPSPFSFVFQLFYHHLYLPAPFTDHTFIAQSPSQLSITFTPLSQLCLFRLQLLPHSPFSVTPFTILFHKFLKFHCDFLFPSLSFSHSSFAVTRFPVFSTPSPPLSTLLSLRFFTFTHRSEPFSPSLSPSCTSTNPFYHGSQPTSTHRSEPPSPFSFTVNLYSTQLYRLATTIVLSLQIYFSSTVVPHFHFEVFVISFSLISFILGSLEKKAMSIN